MLEKRGFDIFIGGPMKKPQDDGTGQTYGSHIASMQRALMLVKQTIEAGRTDLMIRIDSPEFDDRTGTITDKIFNMIDRAELAFLDISADSPSVMYELAMLHALGIPTIPVTLRPAKADATSQNTEGSEDVYIDKPSQAPSGKIPFYLRDTHVSNLGSFEIDMQDDQAARSSEIYTEFLTLTQARIPGAAGILGADPASNPMSKHYGLPMVDISASNGLATGYVHNFLQYVVKASGGPFAVQRKLGNKMKAMVILRPESLRGIVALREELEAELSDLGIDLVQVGEKDGLVYETKEQARGQVLLYRVGQYFVDFPSPLAAQEKSPRFMKLREVMGTSPEDEEIIARRERQMIDEFLRTVTRVVTKYDNTNPNRLMIKTLDEFLDMIRADREAGLL